MSTEAAKTLVLNAELQALLSKMRTNRKFDAKSFVERKCEMFNNYMTKCGLKGCVINTSGGIDSSVTLALVKYASQMKESPIKKIVGITQPIHSSTKLSNNATILAQHLGIDLVNIDQTKIFDQLAPMVEKSIIGDQEPSLFARGQLRSYMRTPVAFFAAQLLNSQGIPTIVVGTGNYDEDGYLFYFCKAGDGISDVQLIHDLHKSEVFSVARELKLPEPVATAIPSADLWEGQTDENELGITYDFVELYTEMLIKFPDEKQMQEELSKLSEESKSLFKEMQTIADKVHRSGKHKVNFPLNLDYLPILQY